MQNFLRRLFFVGICICLLKHGRSLASDDVDPPVPPPACGIVNVGAPLVCEHPWMVYVFDETTHSGCTGTILDETHVLMSAQCASQESNGSKPPGKVKKKRLHTTLSKHYYPKGGIPVASIAIHPKRIHTKCSNCHGLAIVTLEKKLGYNRCQMPICLPNGNMSVYSNMTCYRMGWSLNTAGSTHQVTLWSEMSSHLTRKECDAKFWFMEGCMNHNFCVEEGIFDKPSSNIPREDLFSNILVCEEEGRFYQYGAYSQAFPSHIPGVALYADVRGDLEWIMTHLK